MLRPLSAVVFLLLVLSGAARASAQSELKLWVVEASAESRKECHFDAGLDSIKHVLSALPQDTFRKVSAGTHTLAGEDTTRIAVAGTYTLEVASPAATQDGRYRVRLRILMKSSDDPPREIEALSTELLLQPDKQVLVRGLKQKENGELLLVLSLSVPKTAGGGQTR